MYPFLAPATKKDVTGILLKEINIVLLICISTICASLALRYFFAVFSGTNGYTLHQQTI